MSPAPFIFISSGSPSSVAHSSSSMVPTGSRQPNARWPPMTREPASRVATPWKSRTSRSHSSPSSSLGVPTSGASMAMRSRCMIVSTRRSTGLTTTLMSLPMSVRTLPSRVTDTRVANPSRPFRLCVMSKRSVRKSRKCAWTCEKATAGVGVSGSRSTASATAAAEVAAASQPPTRRAGRRAARASSRRSMTASRRACAAAVAAASTSRAAKDSRVRSRVFIGSAPRSAWLRALYARGAHRR
jgi:hypothetical protein